MSHMACAVSSTESNSMRLIDGFMRNIVCTTFVAASRASEYQVNCWRLLRMTPYQFPSLRDLTAFLAVLLVISLGAFAQEGHQLTTVTTKNDPLTRSGFDHYYNAEYAKAAVDFEKS